MGLSAAPSSLVVAGTWYYQVPGISGSTSTRGGWYQGRLVPRRPVDVVVGRGRSGAGGPTGAGGGARGVPWVRCVAMSDP